MRPVESRLVDVLRDFLSVHETLSRIVALGRTGELAFSDVAELVGDDETAVLFRLKERCHLLFRSESQNLAAEIGPEVLFDLAVGSLFHEAMKLRECLYQRDAYGPKVRVLREAGVVDASGLLSEFDKILDGLAERIDESLAEAETLVTRMVAQLRLLLARHPDNALVARFLTRHQSVVEPVLGTLPEVLAEIHGSAGAGWSVAGVSLLDSGFFEEAVLALGEALERGHEPERSQRLLHYARGMHAYLQGRFAETVSGLAVWGATSFEEADAPRAKLAVAALSRVGPLLDDPGGRLASEAEALIEALQEQGAP